MIDIQFIGRLQSRMQAESQGKFILAFLTRAAFVICSKVSNKIVGWSQLESVVERTVDDQQYFKYEYAMTIWGKRTRVSEFLIEEEYLKLPEHTTQCLDRLPSFPG